MGELRIADGRQLFTVVTRVSLSEGQGEEYRRLQDELMPVFARQPGFIGGAVHISYDGSDALTYLQWRNRADHEACMASPDFEPYNPRWMELLSNGGQFSFNSYQVENVVSSSEASH